MTSASTTGSSPSFWPRSMASATAICCTPRSMLLQILAANPAPLGPQCIIRLPILDRMGETRSNAGSVPPTRKLNVPAFAPATPPLTGASTMVAPALFTSFATLRATSTSSVVESMHKVEVRSSCVSDCRAGMIPPSSVA